MDSGSVPRLHPDNIDVNEFLIGKYQKPQRSHELKTVRSGSVPRLDPNNINVRDIRPFEPMPGYMNQDNVKVDDLEAVKGQHGRLNRNIITAGEFEAQAKGLERLSEDQMNKEMANKFPVSRDPASRNRNMNIGMW